MGWGGGGVRPKDYIGFHRGGVRPNDYNIFFFTIQFLLVIAFLEVDGKIYT